MFRGNANVKIDDKGRLKLPSGFRRDILERHGSELYVTSLFGDCVWIYPMPNWIALEERLAKAPSTNESIRKFRERVNSFGQTTAMDQQGRVLIPPKLRVRARVDGEVIVLGSGDHLLVWNEVVFEERMRAEQLTPEDLRDLSQFGI